MSSAVADNVFTVTVFRGLKAYAAEASSNPALPVRHRWLAMMGVPDDEIELNCAIDPPTDIDDELAEYNAIFQIQDRNQRQ